MEIVALREEYLQKAQKLAYDNYNEERGKVNFLPEVANIPDLNGFANTGLGVDYERFNLWHFISGQSISSRIYAV